MFKSFWGGWYPGRNNGTAFSHQFPCLGHSTVTISLSSVYPFAPRCCQRDELLDTVGSGVKSKSLKLSSSSAEKLTGMRKGLKNLLPSWWLHSTSIAGHLSW